MTVIFAGCVEEEEITPSTSTTPTPTPTITPMPTSTPASTPTATPTLTPEPTITISASDAQQAVQNVLNMMSHVTPIYDEGGHRVGWPKLPSGVDMPTDGQAGTPKLVEKNGISAYEVPVLSDGKRIGEVYVKQKQSAKGEIDFMN